MTDKNSGKLYRIAGPVVVARGLNARMFDELKSRPKVVATGGLARVIVGQTKFVDEIEEDLTMEGLLIIYRRNKRL